MKRKVIWLGIYTHRFGTDYALFDHEPSRDELEKCWEGSYEPERDYENEQGPQDEFLEAQQVFFAGE